LGFASAGFARTVAPRSSAARAHGRDHSAPRDEVLGAHGQSQPRGLPADGGSLRPAPLPYARSRTVVRRLARRLSFDPAADSGPARVVSESAAATRALPAHALCGGAVGRSGDDRGDRRARSPSSDRRRGDGDGRRPMPTSAAPDGTRHRPAQPPGLEDSTGGGSTC